MSQEVAHKFDSKAVFKRLLKYLWAHKTKAIIATFFMICTALTEASFAAIIQPIVNDGFVDAKPWHIKWMASILFALLVLRAIVGYFSNFFTLRLGRNMIYDIRHDTFASLIRLPTQYFDQNSSSKNVSKLIYDAESAAVATTDTLTIMFKDSVLAIALVFWLFYSNWKLTLIFMFTIPFFVGITYISNQRFRKTSKNIQDSMGGIADTVKEASVGQKVIKVYGGHQQEMENFTKANQYNLWQNIKRARVSAGVVPITMLIVGVAISLILHFYLNYLRTGPESAGQFMSYFAACMMLTSPLKRLAKVNEKIQIGMTAANSVFTVIDTEPELDAGHIEMQQTNGHIQFENVTFRYRSDDEFPVINNVNFEVKPGERIAIVGPSGGGKSTLTALMLRFYSPDSGAIKLDGENIADIKLSDLREHVALVSQETTLFDDTIARNIMYGMLDDYDEARLQAAISAARVDEFLDELPQGLDTVVGEHGLRLSGGQRQRIAIARAIYKNSPILILDEATSALDNTSERLVQDALESVMKDRTSLVIAHRLSTIESADKIMVMNNGELAEQGSHKQLLKQGGVYAELYRAQSKSKRRGFFSFNFNR